MVKGMIFPLCWAHSIDDRYRCFFLVAFRIIRIQCALGQVPMPVITLQLGQCGNQIGTELFSALYENACSTSSPVYRNTSLERFFSTDERAAVQPRAVLVDMESKVIQQSVLEAKRHKRWKYDEKCTYSQKRGSGNNWANGYFHYGPSSEATVLDMVQRQAEKCDLLEGFLVLMSVAGGTGSGVGAYVTERLKDEFPHAAVVNQVVWPYASGEVSVQGYNAVLTTSHLQKTADAILLFQNDQLHQTCLKRLQLKDVSFTDINKVISHVLSSALQPAVRLEHLSCESQQQSDGDQAMYRRCSIGDWCAHLCSHVDYKVVSMKSIPWMPDQCHAYSSHLWAGLLKHLRQMLITDSPVEEGMDWMLPLDHKQKPFCTYQSLGSERVNFVRGLNKSVANLLVLRGNELETADWSLFNDPRLYSEWSPGAWRCEAWGSGCGFNKHDKCCTLLTNSQGCIRPLDQLCGKAWAMYSAGAYLHQYDRYGLTKDDMQECFADVELIIKNYATII